MNHNGKYIISIDLDYNNFENIAFFDNYIQFIYGIKKVIEFIKKEYSYIDNLFRIEIFKPNSLEKIYSREFTFNGFECFDSWNDIPERNKNKIK